MTLLSLFAKCKFWIFKEWLLNYSTPCLSLLPSNNLLTGDFWKTAITNSYFVLSLIFQLLREPHQLVNTGQEPLKKILKQQFSRIKIRKKLINNRLEVAVIATSVSPQYWQMTSSPDPSCDVTPDEDTRLQWISIRIVMNSSPYLCVLLLQPMAQPNILGEPDNHYDKKIHWLLLINGSSWVGGVCWAGQ